MLKSDLIALLVQKRGITLAQAETTVEAIFGCMKDALCKGERIELRGVGALFVRRYDSYDGRNPKTGQVIHVKPKRGVIWRTGKELRERVNRPLQSAEPTAPAAPTGTGDPNRGPGSGTPG